MLEALAAVCNYRPLSKGCKLVPVVPPACKDSSFRSIFPGPAVKISERRRQMAGCKFRQSTTKSQRVLDKRLPVSISRVMCIGIRECKKDAEQKYHNCSGTDKLR